MSTSSRRRCRFTTSRRFLRRVIYGPGYWAWDDDTGYYWVPGTWVLPPEPELLWTPGYWGWSDGVYLFHDGYWGPQIGFYGGVAYGFGYTGDGYEGGYWRNGAFFYNQSVNNVSNVSITNVYNKTVVVNNTTNVSYNGGTGGTTAKPTPEQLAAEKERHVAPTAEQTHNVQAAAKDPTLSLNNNQTSQFFFKPVAAAQPQGHRIVGPGNAATTPGNKTGPAITTPGTKVGPAPAAPGAKVGPAATAPGTKVGPEIREHKGTGGGGPSHGATVAHPPTPQASRPTPPPPPPRAAAHPPPPPRAAAPPPPPPRAAAPPPPRAAAAPPPPRPAAPPPRPAAPAGKPKCQPGQHC